MKRYFMMLCFTLFMGWSMVGNGGIGKSKGREKVDICRFLCRVVWSL